MNAGFHPALTRVRSAWRTQDPVAARGSRASPESRDHGSFHAFSEEVSGADASLGFRTFDEWAAVSSGCRSHRSRWHAVTLRVDRCCSRHRRRPGRLRIDRPAHELELAMERC